MYNRYIPNGTTYTRVAEEDAPPFPHPNSPRGGGQGRPPTGAPQWTEDTQKSQRPSASASAFDALLHHGTDARGAREGPEHHPPEDDAPGTPAGSEKKTSWLSSLLKGFKLDELDTGDILLLLILLFLFLDGESDNLEIVIVLGLIVLFGLGGKKKEKEPDQPPA